MDATSIALIIGVATLMIERGFRWGSRIKKSDCLGVHIEMVDLEESKK